MDEKSFPGQQMGEKILYFTRTHPIAKYAFVVKTIIFSILLFLAFWFLEGSLSTLSGLWKLGGVIILFILPTFSWWWANSTFNNSGVYITDRRIVKFWAVSPFVKTTRALFWDEAVKCKTYREHPLVDRILGIGSITVHARSEDKDNVDIDGLSYHEDLANYIDKILFTYKNKPSELVSFHQFVPKPKGQRD